MELCPIALTCSIWGLERSSRRQSSMPTGPSSRSIPPRGHPLWRDTISRHLPEAGTTRHTITQPLQRNPYAWRSKHDASTSPSMPTRKRYPACTTGYIYATSTTSRDKRHPPAASSSMPRWSSCADHNARPHGKHATTFHSSRVKGPAVGTGLLDGVAINV